MRRSRKFWESRLECSAVTFARPWLLRVELSGPDTADHVTPSRKQHLGDRRGYLLDIGDRRLASIGNIGLVSGQYSTYQYTTTPEDFITAIGETSDTSTVYPSTGTQTASYNNLNQLTNLSGQ